MEVLIIVLCPSSLAHWLVGFWSGDSQMFFFFVFFCFCFFFCFFFVFFLFFFCFWFFGLFFLFVFFLFLFLFFYLFGDFQSLLASAGHNPKTNIAPENRPSQKESNLPTIHFQVLC